MAGPALQPFPEPREQVEAECSAPRAGAGLLLDILERSLHASPTEWIFFRELRVGTGRQPRSAQRLDAFALNCLPHLGMKRVCYEVKTSRADYLCELKHPLKRRIGMRYSNEFYFVTPAGLVDVQEVPVECGLIEAGIATYEQWRLIAKRQAGFFSYDGDSGSYCIMTAPAAWRETPGPTWQFVAAMLRNQRAVTAERPVRPAQERLSFE